MNAIGTSQILVVDDEQDMREGIVDLLLRAGYQVRGASSGEIALEEIDRSPVDLVLTDMRMEGMGGLKLLEKIRETRPEIRVIVITAFSSIETAVEAMKRGAFHYIPKPFKVDEVRLVVERALREKRLDEQNAWFRSTIGKEWSDMIGESPPMLRLKELISRAADASSTVLIQGETGTGKELVARSIHRQSRRKDGPFVPLNCAALPESLLEAELFGHARGAFTGATQRRLGVVEAADGGTLFLDEIGELPMSIQAAFLRFLEGGEIRRVGETVPKRVDVRMVAATHRELDKLVREGKFREDLYYRLNVLILKVPPLRERAEDIPALAQHALGRVAAQVHRAPPEISPEAMKQLTRYSWPGNVRELENTLERAVILAPGESIGAEDLPVEVSPRARELVGGELISMAELEKRHILYVLKELGWHRGRAAKLLGISRRTLYRKLLDWKVLDEGSQTEEDSVDDGTLDSE